MNPFVGPVPYIDRPLRSRQHFTMVIDPDAEPPAPWLDIHFVIGRSYRPLLILVAGIHGDEYDGIIALGELIRKLDPEALAGTVAIVPVANPFAFAAGQRRTPEDDKDLNRVFPGRSDGTLTERLADRLCQILFRHADWIFTLHGAMSTGRLVPWIEFLNEDTPVGNATFELARASGFTDLIGLDNLPGRLQRSMADLGIPVVEGEVGGRGDMTVDNVRYYQERVRSLIRHTGLLPPLVPAEPPAAQTIWSLGSIEAQKSGMFLKQAHLGDDVVTGDILGWIVDPAGAIQSVVQAPEPARIGGYRDHVGVRVGDGLFNLWLPADQSRLSERP